MKKQKSRKARLRNLMIMLLLLSIVLAAAISFVSIQLFTVRLRQSRENTAVGSSVLASELIDADKINTWLKDGRDDEYSATEKQLRSILKTTPNLTYLYIYQIHDDGCHVVFDFDDEAKPLDNLAQLIEFDESFLRYKQKLLAGEKIEDIESNDSYGWLLTHYEPIFDSNGKCVAYAGADVIDCNDFAVWAIHSI